MNAHEPPLKKKPEAGAFRRTWRSPSVWLATGLGIGWLRPAPGTWGSLWGVLLAWLVAPLAEPWGLVLAGVVVALIGVPICAAAADRLKAKDPGMIVWDEISGQLLAFTFLPASAIGNPWYLLLGFLLFRLLDITKPPPAKQLERLPHGWGIMADDWLAGLYAAAILHALWRLQWLPS